jgi:hypothetical protein
VPAERVIRPAVERAVSTATVASDQECSFAPQALADVMRFCDSFQGRDAVLAVVEQVLQESVETLDQGRTLAAAMLKVRVEAGTHRRLVPVENLEGNVGTGATEGA